MMVLAPLVMVFAYLSIVSLGGGSAVLPEMQRLCVSHGWLTPDQFAQAYNLGQLAPGPNCMMVVLIGYRVAGLAGAGAVLLSFLIPSALLALGASRAYNRIRGTQLQKHLRDSLAPITVGLIAAGFDLLARSNVATPAAGVICLLTLVALLKSKANPIWLILTGALVGPWIF